MKYLLFFCVILAGCGSGEDKKPVAPPNEEKPKTIEPDTSAKMASLPPHKTTVDAVDASWIPSDKDYLTACDSLELWQGAIQNDKFIKYLFHFGACNSNEQFEMIWVPKGKRYTSTDPRNQFDSLHEVFKNEKHLDYPSFNLAVIEIPKIPGTKLENEFDTEFRFPCEGKVFVRKDGDWYSLGTKQLNDFDDFTELEVEVVKKIDSIEL